MKLKRMTATFGKLDRQVLEPGPGLTVIAAPNEGGKSTWAGFLRAMLYGINTREKDKTGYIAEKNRYAPWGGTPMEGEILLEWQGRDILLRRFAKRTSPFGGFEAVYADSGEPVPGLTADNAGELLVGAGREMYERSAFVGQGNIGVTSSAELEKRVAALVSSGEEGASYSQTDRVLKDWANRRRSNRANGLIPQLDEELDEIDAQLSRLSRTRDDLGRAEEELTALTAQKQELERDLEIHRRLRQRALNRQYAQAREALGKAELARLGGRVKDEEFAGLTGEEAWEKAQARMEEKADLERENQARRAEWAQAEARCAAARKKAALPLLPWLILLVAAVVCAAVKLWPAVALAAAGAAALFVLWLKFRREYAAVKTELEGGPNLLDVPDPGDILGRAAAYREKLVRWEQLEREVEAARRVVDTLKAQGAAEWDTLEELHTPALSLQETTARLGAVQAELSRLERLQAQSSGALSAVGDPDALEARRDQLLEEVAARTEELEALELARAALARANESLRQRFSPALNRLAGELFDRLTGGKYHTLTLSRAFEAMAAAEGDLLPHNSLLLSQGTVDQLYLAVRLAVCQLTLAGEEPAPLVLDDALIHFDDDRMELALELLRELGKERQILLFTCHSREGRWAQERGVPVLRLQSAGE